MHTYVYTCICINVIYVYHHSSLRLSLLELFKSQMLGHSTMVEQMHASHPATLSTDVIESLYGFLTGQQGEKLETITNFFYMGKPAHLNTYLHTYTDTCIILKLFLEIYVHAHTYIHTYTCTHTRTHAHTHTHTKYTHTQSSRHVEITHKYQCKHSPNILQH